MTSVSLIWTKSDVRHDLFPDAASQQSRDVQGARLSAEKLALTTVSADVAFTLPI